MAPQPPPFCDDGRRWKAAMLRGDFAAAWAETDRVEVHRRALERTGQFVWQPHYLLWNGGSFAGRRVLIRCNHGLGDTLQFVRFVPRIQAAARRVTLMVQPPLVELLQGEPSFGDVCNGWKETPPPFDLEMEIMELAYVLRCDAETLSAQVPYLPLAPLRRRCWPWPAAADTRLKVGLLWSASDWDPRRSIPLSSLEPLRQVPGIRCFSLQQGVAAEDRHASNLAIEPLSDRTALLLDAAAALLELDLIITVDSMMAHLAGALGRPVWLLLQHEADWRWMSGRSDSPWYPTMRLFRQPSPGAWDAAVAELIAALPAFISQRAAPCR